MGTDGAAAAATIGGAPAGDTAAAGFLPSPPASKSSPPAALPPLLARATGGNAVTNRTREAARPVCASVSTAGAGDCSNPRTPLTTPPSRRASCGRWGAAKAASSAAPSVGVSSPCHTARQSANAAAATAGCTRECESRQLCSALAAATSAGASMATRMPRSVNTSSQVGAAPLLLLPWVAAGATTLWYSAGCGHSSDGADSLLLGLVSSASWDPKRADSAETDRSNWWPGWMSDGGVTRRAPSQKAASAPEGAWASPARPAAAAVGSGATGTHAVRCSAATTAGCVRRRTHRARMPSMSSKRCVGVRLVASAGRT